MSSSGALIGLVGSAVNFERLAGWMDAQGLASGTIADGRLLTGGTQNIILAFSRGGRRFVLRRPPARPRPGNSETMLREARVLAALSGTAVPHPALIAACADEEILGAAFYLMEPVDGFNATTGPLPALHAGDPAVRRAMGFALVDGAASLGRVDHVAAGLADFGRPEGYLQRQVARWRKQLDGYAVHAGWPGPDCLPGVEKMASYLESECPAEFQPGLIHGDFHFGNVMFRNDGPDLAAIIDWELATIGDPLIDLAWLIATWPGSGGPELDVLKVTPWDGFPTAEELIARYAASSERDLGQIDWYIVLACYKLGIILEGTHARSCAGATSAETGRSLHDTAIRLMQRALHRIA